MTDEKEPDDERLFGKIKPFIEKVAVCSISRDKLFHSCIRASIVKCFEFNLHARQKSDDAFFSLPVLRGICEDLIVLNFIQGMPEKDREDLIQLMMLVDAGTRAKYQDAFFTAVRPQQPVLRYKDIDARIEEFEGQMREIWQRHGWPGLKKKAMPQTRELADKQGSPVLTYLYEYLYRLTSQTVHFNVGSLMRSGWGEPDNCTFSTRHFNPYFSAFGKIYGAYLFCVYFEFFTDFLQPDSEVNETIKEIRKWVIRQSRWPEMLTFEEMNLKVPQKNGVLRFVHSFIQAEESKGFIKQYASVGRKGPKASEGPQRSEP